MISIYQCGTENHLCRESDIPTTGLDLNCPFPKCSGVLDLVGELDIIAANHLIMIQRAHSNVNQDFVEQKQAA